VLGNFGWLEGGRIAGSSLPSSLEHLLWLHRQGIRAIVSLHPINREVQQGIDSIGIAHKLLLVEDMGVPDDGQIQEFLEFVGDQLAQGKPCLVHCYAGIGRTGTMLALYLVSKGVGAHEAIERLGGLQSRAQQALIHEYAARRAAS
jgi:atypical dual specificity phosphatase